MSLKIRMTGGKPGEKDASKVLYDNTKSGLEAENVQSAIDEMSLDSKETATEVKEISENVKIISNDLAVLSESFRNIIASTSDPTPTDGEDGDIWIKYKM